MRKPHMLQVVANAARAVQGRVVQEDKGIRWSSTEGKFLKLNNQTVAEDEQVLQYLREHPDDNLTRERAIVHLGPGVVPPPAIITSSCEAESLLAEFMANMDEWKSGLLRDDQVLIQQGQEVLQQLGSLSQQYTDLRQGLDARDAESQSLLAKVDAIQINIREIAGQLRDQEVMFGQTNQRMAESIAYNQQLSDLLQEVRQQMEDIQEQICQLQSEAALDRTSIQVEESCPVWGIVFASILVALLVGIMVTALAVRDAEPWLDINVPDVVWGIGATTLVFLGFFVALWSLAESRVHPITDGED